MNSKRKQGGATKTHNNRTANAVGSRKGALISAAATIGLLTSQGGDFCDGSALYVQAVKVDQRMGMQARDVVGSDDIGKSSADDMFAFSQIVAAGGNPMEVAAQLEKEAAAKKQEEKKIGGLSEDQAMAAFAEFVSGDGTDQVTVDPRKIQAEKEAAAKAAAARSELKELSSNEATSAFASLVESQVIQEKAATYEGSGTQAEAEAAVAKGQVAAPPQSGDALLAVQKRSEAELTEANKQVETTDCAQEAAAQLGAAGNVQTGEDNATPPAEGAPTDAAAAKPAKPAAANKAADAKKGQAKGAAKAKAAPAKKAAPAAKPKPAPKAPAAPQAAPAAPTPEPERPAIDLDASLAASASKDDAQVDTQADAILDQIRSAAVGIKGLGGAGEGVDEGALAAAMQGMNLLQLGADVRDHDLPDDDSQLAMDYLAQQFPDDYPRDTKKPVTPKGPTPEEKEAADKQELLAYAQRVTEEATASRDQVVNALAEKEERSKLARMGIDGEPVALQLSAENMVQLGSSLRFDADAEQAQSYLESQFPDDFPRDPAPGTPATNPSPEEAQKKEEKEFLRYAERVTEEATESRDRVVQAINDKKEKEELAGWGQKPWQPADRKALEGKRGKMALAQVGALRETENSSGKVLRDAKLVQLSEDIVLDEEEESEQAEEKPAAGADRRRQVTLAQVSQRSREQLVSESEAGEGLGVEESLEEGAEMEAVPQAPVANAPQNDLSGMSADDMRSYSESVAQAADVVNSESEMDKPKEADAKNKGQAAQIKADKQAPQALAAKGAGQQAPKEDQQLMDPEAKGLEMKNPDLEAKAALVAQAESANQAAIEDASQPAGLGKAGAQAQGAKEASLEELDADQKKEQLKQVATAKYAQDKKAALDQGYTDEQAELFAKQEAYAANSMKPNPDQQAPTMQTPDPSLPGGVALPDPQLDTQRNIPKPVSGPTGSPPTIIGRDQAGSTKEAAPPSDPTADLAAATLAAPSVAQTAEESSIEQQIKQAQEQQAMIKAQLEKRKQEKQSLLTMNSIIGAADAPAQAPAAPAQSTKRAAPNQQQEAGEVPALAQAPAPGEAPQQQQETAQAPEQADADSAQRQAQALAEQMGLKMPSPDSAQPQTEVSLNQNPTDANSQSAQAEVKPQEINNQIAQAPAALDVLNKQDQKVSQPVQQAPAEQPLQNDQSIPEKAQPAVKQTRDDRKTHKMEKSTLQESEEIHRHTPKEIKKQLKSLNKGKNRAQQYEEDLNKARDEIQKAQVEMKNIDSEVADFHQKMAKSMHSLLKAFTEGFEAMDKAKTDELDNEIEERAAEKKRASKFDKLNLGISNLEALTSRLKMSFGDEAKDQQPASNEAVQSNSDIHQSSAVANGEAKRDQKATEQTSGASKQRQETNHKTTSVGQKQASKQALATTSQKAVPQNKQQPKAVPKSAVKPHQQPGQKPKPQTVNVINKPQAQKVSNLPQKKSQPQVAPNSQVKQAAKPNQIKNQPKPAAKPQAAAQPPHQMAQVKKVAAKPQAQAHPAKNVKVFKKVQSQSQVATNKPPVQPKQASVQTPKQKLVQQKSQAIKKIAPASKQIVKPAVKKLVVKPIKVNGVQSPQSKMLSAKPVMKNKVQKLVQTKSPPMKPGMKMIQLKKKPAIKVVAKAKKLPNKPALGLAQLTESTSNLNLDNLVQTEQQLATKTESTGQNQQEITDQDDGFQGSDKMIAHTIADRVLMQLQQGKSEEEIMADLGKTKQAFKVAKKAYYEKDPEAIELIQLADTNSLQNYQSQSSGADSKITQTKNDK